MNFQMNTDVQQFKEKLRGVAERKRGKDFDEKAHKGEDQKSSVKQQSITGKAKEVEKKLGRRVREKAL